MVTPSPSSSPSLPQTHQTLQRFCGFGGFGGFHRFGGLGGLAGMAGLVGAGSPRSFGWRCFSFLLLVDGTAFLSSPFWVVLLMLFRAHAITVWTLRVTLRL